MIAWLIENKEWVFGGVGAAVLSGTCTLLWRMFKRGGDSVSQRQASGANSTNVQAGRDINLNKDSSTPRDGR